MNLQDTTYSLQNCREVYLLHMEQNIEIAATDTTVPLQFLETTYQDFDPKHNVTQYVPTIKADGIEVLPVLRNQSDLVQFVQLKLEKPLQNDTNKLMQPTQFVAPLEISPTQCMFKIKNDHSMLNHYEKESTENKRNKNSMKHNYIHISDRIVPQHALAVLPPALQIRRGIVTPRRPLPPYVRFGPIQGIKRTLSYLHAAELISDAAATKTPIFLLKQDNDYFTHIDVSDKDKSNWMCFLPLADDNKANVWIYEENNELYGITRESIHSRKALTLGYSKSYAVEIGLPDGVPVLDLSETNIGQKQWWCYECRKPMASEELLQIHRNAHHKNGKQRRGRYRCRHCKKTFCRLYTMKRHVMTRYCLKNPTQRSDEKPIEEPAEVGLNLTQCTDDNRMPSDESFQNYSNSLDFSTNLFDDRMHSLDMSNNSRGDVFNSYTIDREENLVDDLGFAKGLDCTQNSYLETGALNITWMANSETIKNSEKQLPGNQLATLSNDEIIQETLVNTNPAACLVEPRKQTATRKKKKQQIVDCKEDQFECKCGRVFNSHDKLIKHTYTVCSASKTTKPEPVPTESKYKCEDCQVTFKRRGMLVNHLWRIHNTVPISVPVEKRIRHYPCAVCPKIYRTAAKRNRHVALHHPESASPGAVVECGWGARAAAACGACPRQYASRAKLLQHVRTHHPHLAPPPKNKAKGSEQVF